MKFEPKISGVRVTEFNIEPLFCSQLITLEDCIKTVKRQETMDWLLDTLRFTNGMDGKWHATISYDTDYKLAILENYPEYEKEMIGYFGRGWMKHYIRFNH